MTSGPTIPSDQPALGGFFSNILTPGSSLNPTFLFILDGAFATLLLVFVGLLVLTGGNVHLFFLMIIELCLWASVKWFVSELQKVHAAEAAHKGATERPVDVGSKRKDE